jgi:hypothetical protein
MKIAYASLALAAALAASAAEADTRQLVAHARLAPAEAEGLTLSEIAAHFFNKSTSAGNRQTVVHVSSRGAQPSVGQLAASAGLSPEEVSGLSLTQIAAQVFNKGASSDDQQIVVRVPGRNAGIPAQLAASAGLSPEEASGLSLTEIAARFFNEDNAPQDWQRTTSD